MIDIKRQILINRLLDIWAHGDDGCCICGDDDNHDAWNAGHTPVNAYQYYLDNAKRELKEYDEANAARTQEPGHQQFAVSDLRAPQA